MKKIVLMLLLGFLIPAGPLWALQEGSSNMRELATAQLLEYGKALYQRKEYNEAQHVFKRVLSYDAHNAGALKYMRAMGINVPVTIVAKAAPKNNSGTHTITGIKDARCMLPKNKISAMRAGSSSKDFGTHTITGIKDVCCMLPKNKISAMSAGSSSKDFGTHAITGIKPAPKMARIVTVVSLPKKMPALLPADPNADLKQELANQDTILKQLREEVTALRAQAQTTPDHAAQN